jgi:hypothetical protein
MTKPSKHTAADPLQDIHVLLEAARQQLATLGHRPGERDMLYKLFEEDNEGTARMVLDVVLDLEPGALDTPGP